MRSAASWLLAWLVFCAVLALGAAVLALALIAAPVVLLAGRLLGGRRSARAAAGSRGAHESVYEGEFRVLDETGDERP